MYQCPDGTCADSLIECSISKYHSNNCSVQRPYQCTDLTCVGNIKQCPATIVDKSFATKFLQFTYEPNSYLSINAEKRVVLYNGIEQGEN